MFRRFSSLFFREQKPSLSLSATNLLVYTTVRDDNNTQLSHCPCIFPKITCPLSMYLSAQWLKHVASYELNFEDGDVTHFSKHTFANCATTSLNTALRFSSSRNCCIRGSICW